MTTRIYVVKSKTEGHPARLIRATHPSNALSHVANSLFTVAVAKPDDLVELVSAGVGVETIAQEQQQLPST